MKDNEVYESWKQEKHQIDVSQNFSEQVMNKVYQWEQSRKSSRFAIERLIELISFHPIAKIGLVSVGAVAGIVRLIIMINAILSNGVING
jgi:uncharacterized protein (DUF488 family)